MKKISMPLNDIDIETIYKTCINAYSLKSKRDKLLEYMPQIKNATYEYDKYMPEEFEKIKFLGTDAQVEKDLISVYNYMFVKHRIGGYYDDIISNVNHICPFCGEGIPRNIDHFLPKSIYPLLAVTPANLVPSCRDCNMEKSSEIPECNDDVPLHPYFDDIKDVWLSVKLNFSHKDYLEIIYFNDYEFTDDPKLFNRINAHIKMHGLQANFESHAISMINSKKRVHLKAANQSEEILLEDLKSELESYETEDINSWRAALYRGLISNIKEYKEWLFQYDFVYKRQESINCSIYGG